jgi:hypothetical protein
MGLFVPYGAIRQAFFLWLLILREFGACRPSTRRPQIKKVCPFGSDQIGQHALHPRCVLNATLNRDLADVGVVLDNAGDTIGDGVEAVVDNVGRDLRVVVNADSSHWGFLLNFDTLFYHTRGLLSSPNFHNFTATIVDRFDLCALGLQICESLVQLAFADHSARVDEAVGVLNVQVVHLAIVEVDGVARASIDQHLGFLLISFDDLFYHRPGALSRGYLKFFFLFNQQIVGAIQVIGEDVPIDIAMIHHVANNLLATADQFITILISQYPYAPVLHSSDPP